MDQSTGTVGRSGMGTRKITLGQRENKLDSCISTRISPLEHVVQLQLAPSRYSLSTKPFTSQELWKVPFNVKQVQWLGQVWSMLLRSLILISRPNHSPNKTAIMNPHRTLALTGTLGMEFFYFQRVDLFTLRGEESEWRSPRCPTGQWDGSSGLLAKMAQQGDESNAKMNPTIHQMQEIGNPDIGNTVRKKNEFKNKNEQWEYSGALSFSSPDPGGSSCGRKWLRGGLHRLMDVCFGLPKGFSLKRPWFCHEFSF